MEWGVCMPDVCTNEDVRKNFEFLFKNGEHEYTSLSWGYCMIYESCFGSMKYLCTNNLGPYIWKFQHFENIILVELNIHWLQLVDGIFDWKFATKSNIYIRIYLYVFSSNHAAVCSTLRNDSQYLVSGIDRVTPFTKFLQVKCAEDPEYTATVVITM